MKFTVNRKKLFLLLIATILLALGIVLQAIEPPVTWLPVAEINKLRDTAAGIISKSDYRIDYFSFPTNLPEGFTVKDPRPHENSWDECLIRLVSDNASVTFHQTKLHFVQDTRTFFPANATSKKISLGGYEAMQITSGQTIFITYTDDDFYFVFESHNLSEGILQKIATDLKRTAVRK